MLVDIKKVAATQQNFVVQLEVLAILEALPRWERKLIEYKTHLVTDHKELEFFKIQVLLLPC